MPQQMSSDSRIAYSAPSFVCDIHAHTDAHRVAERAEVGACGVFFHKIHCRSNEVGLAVLAREGACG